MLAVSIALALLAVVLGAVRAREIPALLDLRLLELFFGLTLAAECVRLPRGPDFDPAKVVILESAAANLPGCRLFRVDFTLVAVFAALFVAIDGLHRSALGTPLDPLRLSGTTPAGAGRRSSPCRT
jgi:hypothetical protein